MRLNPACHPTHKKSGTEATKPWPVSEANRTSWPADPRLQEQPAPWRMRSGTIAASQSAIRSDVETDHVDAATEAHATTARARACTAAGAACRPSLTHPVRRDRRRHTIPIGWVTTRDGTPHSSGYDNRESRAPVARHPDPGPAHELAVREGDARCHSLYVLVRLRARVPPQVSLFVCRCVIRHRRYGACGHALRSSSMASSCPDHRASRSPEQARHLDDHRLVALAQQTLSVNIVPADVLREGDGPRLGHDARSRPRPRRSGETAAPGSHPPSPPRREVHRDRTGV